jgi:F0F1-type ATP synthase membrane subunit b/b'
MKEEEEANTAPLANAKATTHVFAEDQQEEEEDENEEGQQEAGEDVDDTLEAAWSSLELARVIFTNYLREKVASGMLIFCF